MEVKIHKSTADEWSVIQKLNAEVYENSSQFDPYLIKDDPYSQSSQEDYKKTVIDPNKFYMIAEIDGIPVGYLVGGENNFAYRNNKRGEIFHMGSSPKFRSLGIGTMLVNEFKKWCKHRGLTHIATSAYYNDPKARHFYEKQGMIPLDIGYEGII